MFYLFYLRRRRADWSSLIMRTSPGLDSDLSLPMAELGLKKEVREMLPIIIYKETFSIRDTQLTLPMKKNVTLKTARREVIDRSFMHKKPLDAVCSVCLGDYQAEDKLQQIPACGHTFHMDCIDHWLANHTTCPLCRLSVLASPKAPDKFPIIQAASSQESSHPANGNGLAVQPVSQGETQGVQPLEQTIGDAGISQCNGDEQECVNQGRDFGNTRNETCEHEGSRGISGNFLLLTSLAILIVFGHCYEMNDACNLFLYMQFWAEASSDIGIARMMQLLRSKGSMDVC
ncbi:Tetratricopeptide repeat-containing protein, putative isoform 1 [Hibiscus syriacus]|uniref:Tetratricopeptide repeat-containing protein, putative isoform 1 n=1 Tax=Hibiscus syriacus TaxID=106335 RepID=A0A6A3C374_HIBSY|nr:Tetratricopeptide repeat-containing protein, putative isoform 1 [Hibiscus syriacus]